MPTALITGANRGIGLEFARQLSQAGWKVFATCRDPDHAEVLHRLASASPPSIQIHSLDTGDAKSISALSDAVGNQPIDLLICNAGTSRMKSALITGAEGERIQDADDALWFEVFRTNTIGPLRVAAAFAERVAASERRLMAFLSSHMSVVARNKSGASYIYRSSKAALNIIIKNLSIELAPRDVTCIVLHPGWVRTDMGGAGADVTPEESVSGMLQVLLDAKLPKHIQFLDFRGETVPW